MGGRPKALLPWPPARPTTTFAGIACQTLRDGGIGPLALITGVHHEAIVAAGLPSGCDAIVHNPAHAEGQLTSVWRGLDWVETLDEQPEWLALALVDIPGVAIETVRALCDAARRRAAMHGGQGHRPVVVRPLVDGRHGHPVLWHRDAWPLLRACPPQLGARAAVRALAVQRRVLDVPVDDAAVIRDVDTEDEFRALIRELRSPD